MKMGERFPVNDPFKQPVLTPKPYLVKGASGSSSTSTSIDTNSSGDSSQGHGNSDSDSSTSSTSTNCTGNEQGEGRICREQYLHGILEVYSHMYTLVHLCTYIDTCTYIPIKAFCMVYK